ncbi:MAG: hypothetical protein A2271_02740 [Candidatus Moranbacteria bacterium RIFOXYA12_FULL_35_19]|nr:MAG: hypothetical protein UR78_C0006G0029 [Candidatus Moranbacteria bacterium GW2011_GWF2_35_39]OGI32723.1 MAG: hypothetical protein A2343_01860 [Candidatus Moranbacteria bacterium RIFOXYB12_FULL_35_8]OGI32972.1 MAG: hypothetical protein A2489_00980 [Candidatus Moranbacteria bacterium RIFOXYC12_FULL_36_13]OGI36717.1 MAG: hypothetical protein A2271_02740 [Candidatus Moranbacteria bacterium RIFOXYA12_FULL_35_19]
MTTITVIENKISAVRKYLKILERYKNIPFPEILADVDKKGALERYLYLAVQATIDLADAIVSYKNFRKPTTMSEFFHILNENGIISDGITGKMVAMTGFRNIMAHDYEKVDYAVLENILRNGLDDIDEFLENIEKI